MEVMAVAWGLLGIDNNGDGDGDGDDDDDDDDRVGK